ncbi:MAG: Gx transporter family protein [Clostridia bacterium]|nr:Gx transporter family protein [Clostridia bacterium]
MKNKAAKKAALYGIMVALAFTLSYLEHLFPLPVGIPGVKLGLANIVVLTALYILTPAEAVPVAAIRILLAGLTFGNAFSMLYSLAGGAVSFLVMWAGKKSPLSPVGVSVLGGVSHNVGQLAAAALITRSAGIFWYLPVLLAAGVGAGLLNGAIALPVIRRFSKPAA